MFGANLAAMLRNRASGQMLRDLITSRKIRDKSVNNTANGFEPPEELDRQRYSRRSGRRCG